MDVVTLGMARRLTRGRLPGNRVAFLGDSITRAGDLDVGSDSGITLQRADSWPNHAGMTSGQRINVVRNAGKSGDTTTGMLSRFDAEVTPYAPNVVCLLGGTNDLAGAVTLATFQTNIKAFVAKTRAIDALPVLCTLPPRSTSTYWTALQTWNAWLAIYAAAERLPLIDFHGLLINPTSGDYAAAYSSGDGLHPSRAGYKAMGQLAASTLSAWLPPYSPILTKSSGDRINGGTPVTLGSFDGCFTGTPTAGRAGNWALYSALPTGATASVSTADTNVLGSMQRVTMSGSTASAFIYRSPSVGNASNNAMQVGDKIAFSGIVTTSGIGASLQINFNGNGKTCYPLNIDSDVTRGRYYGEFTIPTGTTSIDHILTFKQGTGYAEFGQVTMYDLTQLGIG
jgi:acyl-CoA thioesterase-1